LLNRAWCLGFAGWISWKNFLISGILVRYTLCELIADGWYRNSLSIFCKEARSGSE